MDNAISFTPAQLVAFIGTVAGVCAGLHTNNNSLAKKIVYTSILMIYKL